MQCEMCGKEVPVTRPMMVEGTKLNLCPDCARFGDEYKVSSGTGGYSGRSSGEGDEPYPKSVIEERLEKRERRMQTRDVYAGTGTTELVSDYGARIRNARVKKGLTPEDFAKSISEKKGTLIKVESNSLVPDDKLIAKLEKALDIKLREAVQDGAVVGGQQSQSMTLGNFVKVEKDSKKKN